MARIAPHHDAGDSDRRAEAGLVQGQQRGDGEPDGGYERQLVEGEASDEAQCPHDEWPARRRQSAEHTAGDERRGYEVSDRHATILAAVRARGIGHPVRQASAFWLRSIGRKGPKVRRDTASATVFGGLRALTALSCSNAT